MKTQFQSPTERRQSRRRAIALVECMVYIALVMLIVGLGLNMYLRLLGFHRDLERNNNDITRVLRAGEIWRADIRSAESVAVSTENDTTVRLELRNHDDLVSYRFEDETLWRSIGDGSAASPFLGGVADCRFIKETRDQVSAWRWEIHLKTKKKTVRIDPRFSFLAVSTPQEKGDTE